MDLKAVIARIEIKRTELGLSEASVAVSGGSRDLIRNWRRSIANGKGIQAKYESLSAIAAALGVDTDWLINGDTDNNATTARAYGFSELAAPYEFQEQIVPAHSAQPSLHAIFGKTATTPATYIITHDLPVFALLAGDVILVDLSRAPKPGELTIVSQFDDEHATSITSVFRYFPPFLQNGHSRQDEIPLRIDQPGVTVRYPVIGSMRGIPHS